MTLLVLVCALAQDRNLLRNPSFEEGEGDLPRDWTAIAPPQHRDGVDFAADTKEAKAGRRSARIKNSDPTNLAVNSFTQRLDSDTVADLRGKWVELSAEVRGRDVTSADVWIQCFDDVDRELGRIRPKRYGALFGTFPWTRLEARGEIPAKATSIVVRCVVRGTGEAGFDDVTLRMIKPPAAEAPPKLPEEQAKLRDSVAKFVAGGEKPAASIEEIRRALAHGLGPAPWATGYKKFTFRARDREWSYEVWIPPQAKEGGSFAMLLDPGHPKGAGDHKNWVELGARDLFVVRSGVYDETDRTGEHEKLMEKGIEGELFYADVFAALVRDARTRLPVDADRVYATGLSMTAYSDWMVCALRPDLFAGAAPFAGMPRNWFSLVPALKGQRWFVAHGDADTVCPVAMARKAAALLKDAGVEHVYREHRALGHGDVIVDRGNALEWLVEKPRNPYPKAVSLRLVASGGAHWLDAEAAPKEVAWDKDTGYAPIAAADGEIKDNVVTVKAAGVTKLTVRLSSRLVDFSRPVTFVVNGAKTEKTVAPSVDVLLERLKATADASALYEAVVELEVRQ